MKECARTQCVDVIATLEDRFAVIERLSSLPGLAWPGGKVELGESLEGAARREVLEETGLSLEIAGCVGYYDAPGRDPRGAYVSLVFHGRVTGDPRDETGKTRVLFLTRPEVESRLPEFILDHADMFRDFVKQK